MKPASSVLPNKTFGKPSRLTTVLSFSQTTGLEVGNIDRLHLNPKWTTSSHENSGNKSDRKLPEG